MRVFFVISLLTLVQVDFAAAQNARIAVLARDPELVASLFAALAPWEIEAVLMDEPVEGPGMADPTEHGREIASVTDVTAVVWLSEREEGWAVWLYDRGVDRVLDRSLSSGPPFDEATAAAVVLSIMTLLRATEAAPPEERAPLPDVPVPSALLDAPMPQEPIGSPSPRPPADESASSPPMPARAGAASTPSRQRGHLELTGGLEHAAASPPGLEARLSVGGAYWPAAFDGALGIGLAARTGAGLSLVSGDLTARLFDARLLARLHFRARLGRRWQIGALAGLGARLTVLDGALEARNVREVRLMGVGELLAALDLDLAPVLVSLRAGVASTPWRQRYELDGSAVLSTSAVWPMVELALGMTL